MRWVCPGCGSQVSVALNVCPNCGSTEESVSPARAAAPATSPAAPAEEKAAESRVTPAPPPKPAPAPPAARAPKQPLLPVPRPAAEDREEREGPFWRGVKFGVGFMFAVAMILLLLAMFLAWLREQGWQPWLEGGAP